MTAGELPGSDTNEWYLPMSKAPVRIINRKGYKWCPRLHTCISFWRLKTPFPCWHPIATKRITYSLMVVYQVSHLLSFLSQCDMVHALTFSPFTISSVLNLFCSSSSDKEDCTHPASSAIPIGPAVAKRLSEERESDPAHTIFPTDPSIPPICCSIPTEIPLMQPWYQEIQIKRVFMGCFLPLTSTTERALKYKKHYSRQHIIRELALVAIQTTLLWEATKTRTGRRSCHRLEGTCRQRVRFTKISLESQAKSGPSEVPANGRVLDWMDSHSTAGSPSKS